MRILKRVTAILGCVSILMCSFLVPASAYSARKVPYSCPVVNNPNACWMTEYAECFPYWVVLTDSASNVVHTCTYNKSRKQLEYQTWNKNQSKAITIYVFRCDDSTVTYSNSYLVNAGSSVTWRVGGLNSISTYNIGMVGDYMYNYIPQFTDNTNVNLSPLFPYLQSLIDGNTEQNNKLNQLIELNKTNNQTLNTLLAYIKNINDNVSFNGTQLRLINEKLDNLLTNSGAPAPTSPNAENEMSQYDEAQSGLPTVPDMELTTDPDLTAGIETNSRFITLLIEKTHMMPFIVFALTMALATFLIGRKVA